MAGPGILPTDAIYAGDDWSRILTIQQGGSPVDLASAGWTNWTAQWRPDPGTASKIDLTVDDTAAASGQITVSLTGAQTESMGGNGVWDLQAEDSDGNTVTWVRGSTVWTQDVTR